MELPTPAASEKATILKEAVAVRGFVCSEYTALEVATQCNGADAFDMVVHLHSFLFPLILDHPD